MSKKKNLSFFLISVIMFCFFAFIPTNASSGIIENPRPQVPASQRLVWVLEDLGIDPYYMTLRDWQRVFKDPELLVENLSLAQINQILLDAGILTQETIYRNINDGVALAGVNPGAIMWEEFQYLPNPVLDAPVGEMNLRDLEYILMYAGISPANTELENFLAGLRLSGALPEHIRIEDAIYRIDRIKNYPMDTSISDFVDLVSDLGLDTIFSQDQDHYQDYSLQNIDAMVQEMIDQGMSPEEIDQYLRDRGIITETVTVDPDYIGAVFKQNATLYEAEQKFNEISQEAGVNNEAMMYALQEIYADPHMTESEKKLAVKNTLISFGYENEAKYCAIPTAFFLPETRFIQGVHASDDLKNICEEIQKQMEEAERLKSLQQQLEALSGGSIPNAGYTTTGAMSPTGAGAAGSVSAGVTSNLFNPLQKILQEFGNQPKMQLAGFIGVILGGLMKILIGLTLIFLVIGGIMYMLAGGIQARMESAKKVIFYSIFGFALAAGATIILTEIAIALGGLTGDLNSLFAISPKIKEVIDSVPEKGMSAVLTNVLNLLLKLLGMFGVIGIIIGSLWMLGSGGKEERYQLGVKTLYYSIVGLLVAIGSMVIVKQIENLIQ
ncbi:MAG: hypothetical protein GF332_00225 [Candidatus Moranbacteria bacterium]|nr:hypothetical protein [Candidatus Moranbacteria bacterium]